jgi:hypothetical protein
MSTQTNPKQPNITQQLDALFDQVGPDALCLPFAQALAEAHGLNRTSAGIRFYRWLAARTAPVGQQQAA